MSNMEQPNNATAVRISPMELDYLLKELELLASAESTWRDRGEQIVQFFLTALTGIVGAVLLAVQVTGTSLLPSVTILIGTTAILAFAIFAFIRVCIYRNAVSYIRLRQLLIRRRLLNHSVRPAELELPNDTKSINGFTMAFVVFLIIFSIICGLIFSIAVIAGIATVLYMLGWDMFNPNIAYYTLYGLSALLGFLICYSSLVSILRYYRHASENLVRPYLLVKDNVQKLATTHFADEELLQHLLLIQRTNNKSV